MNVIHPATPVSGISIIYLTNGLLDWRLALDMARLADSPAVTIDLDSSWGENENPWSVLLQTDNAPVPATMKRIGYVQRTEFAGLHAYIHGSSHRRQILNRTPSLMDR